MTTLAKTDSPVRDRTDHQERRVGRRRLSLIGGAILIVALVLVLRGAGGKKKAPATPPPRPVEVVSVIQQDVPLYLDEIGTTAAFETVQVQAQVSGQIIAREFQDGAEVKKGDLLFRIDPRPYEAALASAKADHELAQSTMQRQTQLQSRNVSATQEVDTARATAGRAQAALAAAQVNLDFASIRSPIDGRVGLRNVDVGNVVGPSSPPLVTIQGLDPIYTDFTVAEPDLPLVRRYLENPNLKVVTDADGDNVDPRTGDLYFIDNAVQPGAGTVRLRGVTPNPDRALWPSQYVKVRLILDILKDAKLVPSGAVQIGQNGPYVFVVRPDSTLDLRPVKPGQAQGDLVVISEGVSAGESVVVSGQLQLSPGMKVNAKPAPTAGGHVSQASTIH